MAWIKATEAPKPVFNEVGTCGTIPLEVTRKCLVGLKIHQGNKNTTSTVPIILSIIRWKIITHHQKPWRITLFVKGYHVIDHLKSLKIMMNSNEPARIITKHKSLLLYTIVNHHKLLLQTGMHRKSFCVIVNLYRSLHMHVIVTQKAKHIDTFHDAVTKTHWIWQSQKSDGHQHIQLTIVNLGINSQTSYEPSSFVKETCDQQCKTLVYGVCGLDSWFLFFEKNSWYDLDTSLQGQTEERWKMMQ